MRSRLIQDSAVTLKNSPKCHDSLKELGCIHCVANMEIYAVVSDLPEPSQFIDLVLHTLIIKLTRSILCQVVLQHNSYFFCEIYMSVGCGFIELGL